MTVALCYFLYTIGFFHTSEVALVLLIEPEEFSHRSFLLSWQYITAMICGLAEHVARGQLSVSARSSTWLYTGLTMVLCGEVLRKAAWLTARSSFTHLIKERRRDRHMLVTHGVYAFSRHPGYLGWLVWAVGTQIMLGNSLCTLAFAVVAWRFFKDRIPAEEWHLRRIFGDRYRRYREKVPTRIPGIS